MRRIVSTVIVILLFTSVYALPFNQQLSETDIQKLNAGECIIRNIDYAKNMSLKEGINTRCNEIITLIKELNPKYLGEVILIKPIKGNEDLPKQIDTLLNGIENYTDIPYWSEQAQQWYMLYDDAKIISKKSNGNTTEIDADLIMEPVGNLKEKIYIVNDGNILFYSSTNMNPLKYYDKFTVLTKEKLKIGIVVFPFEDNWIIYGVGGINAPHIPFFTERIRTSFINRICTFCNYIFTKL